MKLVIIGNGFDLAHGLKSSYRDFGDYIENKYPAFYTNLISAFNNDSGIWGDFEAALPLCGNELENNGLQMMQERLQEIDYTPTDDEGIKYWLKDQYNFINRLPSVLRNWANSILRPPIRCCYKSSLFEADAKYLTFNYTQTLECLYFIKSEQVLHIHGSVASLSEPLIMGHGDLQSITCVQNRVEEAKSEHDSITTAVYDCVLKYLQSSYKNSSSIISKNSAFFDGLDNVDEIEVIGCSLSKADEPYFAAIESKCHKHWTFYYHDSTCNYERFVEKNAIPASRYMIISDKEILV